MNSIPIKPCFGLVFHALTEGEPLPDLPDMPSYGFLLLQTVVALILVCVLAYVFLRYGLKWLLPRQKGSVNVMKVIDRLPLDGRRMIYLVEIGKKVLVLAATDGGISKVGELDEEETALLTDRMEQERKTAEESSGKRIFSDVLERIRKKKPDSASDPQSAVGETVEKDKEEER